MTTDQVTLSVIIAAVAGVFLFLFTALGTVIAYVKYRNEREGKKEQILLHSQDQHHQHDHRLTILEREFQQMKSSVDELRSEVKLIHRDTTDLIRHLVRNNSGGNS